MMQTCVEVLTQVLHLVITSLLQTMMDYHFDNYYEAGIQTLLIISHTFLSLCVFAVVK